MTRSIRKKSKAVEHVFLTREYTQVLSDIKKQANAAQVEAAIAATKELSALYWSIGKTITEKQGGKD